MEIQDDVVCLEAGRPSALGRKLMKSWSDFLKGLVLSRKNLSRILALQFCGLGSQIGCEICSTTFGIKDELVFRDALSLCKIRKGEGGTTIRGLSSDTLLAQVKATSKIIFRVQCLRKVDAAGSKVGRVNFSSTKLRSQEGGIGFQGFLMWRTSLKNCFASNLEAKGGGIRADMQILLTWALISQAIIKQLRSRIKPLEHPQLMDFDPYTCTIFHL